MLTGNIGSTTSLQISTLPSTSGPAPYCCSEPSCPCEGGRAAKAALETRQQLDNAEDVRISLRAIELYSGENSSAAGESITTQALAPIAQASPTDFPDSTLLPERTASVAAAPLPALASAYLDTAAIEQTTTKQIGQRVNTYA